MKTRTIRTARRNSKPGHVRGGEHGNVSVMESIPEVKTVCSHCGGMIKYEPDGASCVMCGRDVSHSCSNCMHIAKSAA